MTKGKELIVYKASAGSGKTYTLTKEYIGLLLRGWYKDHVSKHDRILAATFTNKATIELRERILRELINIRDGKEKNLGEVLLNEWEEAHEYEPTDLAKKRKELPEVANSLLRAILEDYGSFKVQTIDSFFQEVVRSFALEISSLAGAYNIELKENEFITLSLDQLFLRLGEEGNQKILTALEELYKIDFDSGEEKKNISKQLVNLARTFWEDDNWDLEEYNQIYSPQNTGIVRNKLNDYIIKTNNDVSAKVRRLYNKLAAVRDTYNLDFSASSGKGGMLLSLHSKLSDPKSFIKSNVNNTKELISTTLAKVLDDDKALFIPKSKYKPGSEVYDSYAAADDDLRSVLREVQALDNEITTITRRKYITASLILEYIDLMPLLIEAKKTIEQYQREQNVVLISRINILLRDIIKGSDIPFIYDKVGTRIEHYMIDEFQDTSRSQWDNFTPLLKESLAYGRYNYLVGDVKQSIYRFRGADSSLLGVGVESTFSETKVVQLDTNWRSDFEIVNFNNKFFDNIYEDTIGCLDNLPENKSHSQVYASDVEQNAHHEKGGYVQLKINNQGMNEHYETVKQEILDLIVELQQDKGFRRKDIAILVFENNEATLIANWLNEASALHPENADLYKFVSDQALNVSSSFTVKLLTQFISFVANNRTDEKEIELRVFLDIYLNQIEYTQDKEYVFNQLLELSSAGLGLYETISQLVSILQVPSFEMIYVNALMDHLFAFTSKNAATFRLFDDWWNRECDTLRVEMGSVSQDSITIITVHKSKGLEFPVVIMPNADRTFSIKKTSTIKRYNSNEDLKKDLEIEIPDYYLSSQPDSRHLSSYFESQFKTQMEEDFMDTLNLLYVAFTRAEQHLYVYAPIPIKLTPSVKPSYEITSSGELLFLRAIAKFGNQDSLTWEFGYRHNAHEKESKVTRIHNLSSLSATPRYSQLKFSTNRYTDEKIQEGKLLHHILETSRTSDDFCRSLEQAVRSNRLTAESATQFNQRFDDAMSNPTINKWFTTSDEQYILSENSISECVDTSLSRPDRMILNPSTKEVTIIDYKFGKQQSYYKSQIERYAHLLREMGYTPTAYLWYNLSADPADIIRVS